MKYIVALAALTLGYAVCSPAIRELVVSQPLWLMITEGVLAYLVCGIPAFVFAATNYVRNHGQHVPDGQDIGSGLGAVLVWPVYACYYAYRYAWKSFKIGSFNEALGAYGRKRRKSVDKKS